MREGEEAEATAVRGAELDSPKHAARARPQGGPLRTQLLAELASQENSTGFHKAELLVSLPEPRVR